MKMSPDAIRANYAAFGLPMTYSLRIADVNARVRLNHPTNGRVNRNRAEAKARRDERRKFLERYLGAPLSALPKKKEAA